MCGVFMVDISEFTNLTLYLANFTDGAEQMSLILNSYFGRMIETVAAYHGSVIKFAGDALLCFFPSTRDREGGGRMGMLVVLLVLLMGLLVGLAGPVWRCWSSWSWSKSCLQLRRVREGAGSKKGSRGGVAC